MLEAGVTTLVEVGPGKVLSGLIKRIDRSVEVLTVSDEGSFDRVKPVLVECCQKR